MSHPACYQPNQPFVVSELIDGEVVIMNLQTGNYFSARHTGALCWAWLETGRDPATLADGLAALYGGDPATYRADCEGFLGALVEHALVRPGDGLPAPAVAPPPAPAHYQPPLLEVFADMQDLLLLDPIHDTDEMGWPVAKPTRPAA